MQFPLLVSREHFTFLSTLCWAAEYTFHESTCLLSTMIYLTYHCENAFENLIIYNLNKIEIFLHTLESHSFVQTYNGHRRTLCSVTDGREMAFPSSFTAGPPQWQFLILLLTEMPQACVTQRKCRQHSYVCCWSARNKERSYLQWKISVKNISKILPTS
jgi:hypothetical protein